MKRWRVFIVAVDGTERGELGRSFTRRGAERIERLHRTVGREMYGRKAPTGILEPLPGMPLYSLHIDRVA